MLCNSSMMASVSVLPPTRPIPGSYGLLVIGRLRDRLDYFWFQGQETFFRSRMASHNSTVFRTNMPPTFPFFLDIDPRVICLLDCASFSSFFNLSIIGDANCPFGIVKNPSDAIHPFQNNKNPSDDISPFRIYKHLE